MTYKEVMYKRLVFYKLQVAVLANLIVYISVYDFYTILGGDEPLKILIIMRMLTLCSKYNSN